MTWNFLKHLFCPCRCPVALFGRTDTGKTRPNNEDSFSILPHNNLMMVADGMGGHNAGEIASRTAIKSMIQVLVPDALNQASNNQNEIRHLLIHGLCKVNEQVIDKAREDQAYSGMGCTFILGYVNKGLFYTCHVGDVRAYLLTKDLRQLTQDHTYVAEIARGDLSKTQSSDSAKVTRHVVSRAVGFPFPEDPDCTITPVAKGDRILLCSDGLWSMLPDARLESILRQASTPEEACDTLIAEANKAGGKDNITAVVGFV
ncbi:MAG: protein phosphatase 2C domain-containing protein [Proteobacteria bacterium]|nr:serine/threonine-protein phosphatase [Desulfobulbaceae bacterium]MBU4151970.1 protein phosphatase 2C domain-containing protein [Pseudomonadota bacterium]MDP2104961.1 protein phosphatase 2C domain-containing protein [Desulfobulbaceae bacterium]